MSMHNASNPPPFPIPEGAQLAPSDKGVLRFTVRDYLRASSVRSAPPTTTASTAQPRMLKAEATRSPTGILYTPLDQIRRDEVDPGDVGVRLMGPAKYDDGTPKRLRWEQLATLRDAAVMRASMARLPYAVGDGAPYVQGQARPAAGWIHRLDDRGPAGLWGLTEWLRRDSYLVTSRAGGRP